jgi:hypothetical protein
VKNAYSGLKSDSDFPIGALVAYQMGPPRWKIHEVIGNNVYVISLKSGSDGVLYKNEFSNFEWRVIHNGLDRMLDEI